MIVPPNQLQHSLSFPMKNGAPVSVGQGEGEGAGRRRRRGREEEEGRRGGREEEEEGEGKREERGGEDGEGRMEDEGKGRSRMWLNTCPLTHMNRDGGVGETDLWDPLRRTGTHPQPIKSNGKNDIAVLPSITSAVWEHHRTILRQ